MPRLEGGTNNTSKIAIIVVGVLIAAGVAWYAMSGSQNTDGIESATPVPSASGSPQAGSPPAPPDDTTTAMPDNTGNTAGSEMGGDMTPAPDAMDGGAMSSETPMGGADAMASPTESSGDAGVTMTPAAGADAMSSDAPVQAPAAR